MSKKMKWNGKGSIKGAMRSDLNLLCLAAAAVFCLSPPVLAQDGKIQAPSHQAQPGNVAKVQELQRIIEAQQRQLDKQQKQLEGQSKTLQELRQQVEGLALGEAPPEAPAAEKSTATPSKGAVPRRTDTQTRIRDKDHPHKDWKGSFGVEGLNTRFKIGGFAQLDVIHDTDAIASKGQFVTSTIVTRDATKTEGADGQTSFSVQPTRLYFETRTPVKKGRLTTFLSMDFFGDALGVTPDPRLRQGYGELTNILFGGDLLAGQAWTTFSDLEAYPTSSISRDPTAFLVRASRWCAGAEGSPRGSNCWLPRKRRRTTSSRGQTRSRPGPMACSPWSGTRPPST